MKRVSLVMALLAILALTTSAFGFSLNQSYVGPVKIKYSNWEELVVPGFQNELSGIASVTSINAINPQNTLLWSPSANAELTAVFEGYTLAYVNDPAGPSAQYYFTGGTYTVYYDTTPDFDATYPSTGVTDGIVFLTMKGIPGIVPVDDPTTVAFDESTTTLYSDLSTETNPVSGTGTGYLEITGGAFAWLFGGVGAEMFVISDFNEPTLDRPGYGWPIVSEDPIVGNVVPEPGTFLLVGAGLVGLGFLARRRRDD